jgi:hypothetical protein
MNGELRLYTTRTKLEDKTVEVAGMIVNYETIKKENRV